MQISGGIGIPGSGGGGDGPPGGFVAWFNTADASTTAWLDTSGAYTLSGSATVTASNADLGNAQTVDFNGSSHEMIESGTLANNFSGDDTPFMWVWAMKVNTLALEVPIQIKRASASQPRFRTTISASDGSGEIFRRDDANAGGTVDSGAAGTFDTSSHIYAMVFDGATMTLRIDGVSAISGASAIGTLTLDTVAVGSGDGASYCAADYGDIVAYNTYNAATLQGAEAFLASKFGVSL